MVVANLNVGTGSAGTKLAPLTINVATLNATGATNQTGSLFVSDANGVVNVGNVSVGNFNLTASGTGATVNLTQSTLDSHNIVVKIRDGTINVSLPPTSSVLT